MPTADERRAALTRTMPCAGLDAAAAAATPPAPAPPEAPPAFADDGLAVRLERAGLPPSGERRRFVVAGALGSGATGHVYALIDRDLDRPVAVKVLARRGADDVRSFVEEARITASLSHPNVLPVHDLDVDPAGRVFFTMKQIDGRSLADAIEASATRRAAPLDDVNALANVFIGVCQALAYAHHRGVVHQDVKPANIMLGAFGEVLLVDWGAACRLADGAEAKIYGSPLYMSPEQTRGERVDARSDVYCVGATLFHALFLRPPTWHDDAERFFERKRRGEIDEPTAAERATAPAALVDIALQAMRADPGARYADAEALLADLRAFQGGLRVRAHRETALERLARWHRRHRATLWPSLAALAALVALGAALWGERLARIARWGAPVVAEDFADDGWRGSWRVIDGGFARRDAGMVSTGTVRNLLLLDRKLRGDVAIEYEAEILPGSHPADLSLLWARDVARGADGAITGLVDPYEFQFGACDGRYSALSHRSEFLVTCYRRPEAGRSYRVRVEVADGRATMSVDGRPLFQWNAEDQIDGGWIALMTYTPGKAFRRVRVSVRGVPEHAPATAAGDALARDGRLDAAADAYLDVVDSLPNAAIADEARFKVGRCRWRQGRRGEAEAAWAAIRDRTWRDQARLERIEALSGDGANDRVLAELDDLGASPSALIREHAGLRWQRCSAAARARDDQPLMGRYLALHDRRFADLAALDGEAGYLLLALDRPGEAVARYPGLPQIGIEALLDIGRGDLAIERYAGMSYWLDHARFASGLGDRIAPDALLYPSALVHRGLAEQALAAGRDDPRLMTVALCQLGRLDEALETAKSVDAGERAAVRVLRGEPVDAAELSDRGARVMSLLAADDVAGVYATASSRSIYRHQAGLTLAIEAWRAGDAARAETTCAVPMGVWRGNSSLAFAVRCVAPFARTLGTGAGWDAFDAALEPMLAERYATQQRPWFDARYLLGEIDDAAFVAQPAAAYASTLLLTRRAMRRERLGDRAGALADWRAWLALPRWRRGSVIDLPLEHLARWRIEALSR